MALAGLTRTAIAVKDSSLSDQLKYDWEAAITKMRSKLESVLH
jgi:hypothetical protein